MRLLLLTLMAFLPSTCYATIGLDGLVIFDYLFYIIAAVGLSASIIIASSFSIKSNTFETLKNSPGFILVNIILILTLPVYYYLSITPHSYWLCLLHLCLSFLMVRFYVGSRKTQWPVKLSIVLIGFILALITPNFVNLNKYVLVENNPLQNEKEVYVNYLNNIIEFDDGFYSKQFLHSILKSGDKLELKEMDSKYFVLRKDVDYYYVMGSKYSVISDHLFYIPLLEKKVNKYRTIQPQGFLTKYDEIGWKVAPDILLKFESCNLRELKAIISRGADVNIKMARGFTILHKMAFCGTAEHIKFLLAQGAEINAQTTDGYTALIPALSNKTDSYNIVKLLLGSGADISLVYKDNTIFVDKLDALTGEQKNRMLSLIDSR